MLSEQNNKYDTTALYYGDSNVKIGEKFTITCIIPINNPIHWYKNEEPISRHNLRHGRDDHSYVLFESAIEGEKHKIEAHISVRHALKVHEGKYRCNNLHSNYHHLRVHSSLQEPQLPTQSPFIVLSEYNQRNNNDTWTKYEATEAVSIYETMHDIKPNKDINDIFTRVWSHPQQTTTLSPKHQHQSHHHHHSPHHENALGKDDALNITLTNLSEDYDLEDIGNKMKTTIAAIDQAATPKNFSQYPYTIYTNEPDITTIMAFDERKQPTNNNINTMFTTSQGLPQFDTSPRTKLQSIPYDTFQQREQLTFPMQTIATQRPQEILYNQQHQQQHQRTNNLFTVNTPSGLDIKPTPPFLKKGENIESS